MVSLKHISSDKEFVSKDIRVIPSQNRVICNGQDNVVQPKVMQLLVLLYKANGETVSKQQLIDAIWPDIVVSQESLANVVTRLRRVVNDSAKQPEYIETVQGIGYRWIAPTNIPHPLKRRRVAVIALGFVFVIFGAVVMMRYAHQPSNDVIISDLKVIPTEKGVEIAVGLSTDSLNGLSEAAMLKEVEKITGVDTNKQRVKIKIDEEPTVE